MITTTTPAKTRRKHNKGNDNFIVESGEQITMQVKKLNRNLMTSILVHIGNLDVKETSCDCGERSLFMEINMKAFNAQRILQKAKYPMRLNSRYK